MCTLYTHQALQASEQLLAHERSLLEEVQRPDGDGCSVDEYAAALVPSHTRTPLNSLAPAMCPHMAPNLRP